MDQSDCVRGSRLAVLLGARMRYAQRGQFKRLPAAIASLYLAGGLRSRT